jgi:hypothetical protein
VVKRTIDANQGQPVAKRMYDDHAVKRIAVVRVRKWELFVASAIVWVIGSTVSP